MYYVDFWAEMPDQTHRYAICLARSLFSAGGKPGTWFKWYNGTWTEPGVKGRCSPIANMSGVATANVTVRWSHSQAVATNLILSLPSTFTGTMSASADGLKFYRLNGPFVPNLSDITNNGQRATNSDSWFLGYSTFVQESDDKLWMYSMNLASGRGDVRSIVRFPMDIRMRAYPGCGGRVTLARYRSTTSADIWVTWQPQEPQKYALLEEVGHLSMCSTPLTKQLVDCYSVDLRRHFIATATECLSASTTPDGTNSTLVYLGSLGQIRSSPYGSLIPLNRCFDPATKIYGIAVNQDCPVSHMQWTLGYMMPLVDLSDDDSDAASVFSVKSTLKSDRSGSLKSDGFYDPSQPAIGPYATEGILLDDAVLSLKTSSILIDQQQQEKSINRLSSLSTVVTIVASVSVSCAVALALIIYVQRKRRVHLRTTSSIEDQAVYVVNL
mmetsp:Transcript_2664/g.4085  ORF Transcript_2664/g.4085 Transcript_2664/m.4085 type:complete len:440 (+) Transcript_2664:154-1473(+)